MAIEPVNERPIFPQLFRADSQNVSYWSTSMIRQLTTVFQQYGYRLNRTLLAGGLTTNANTLSASGGYVLTENAVGTPVADTPNIAVLHADTSTSDNPLRRGATQIAFVTDGAAPATYRRARNNDAASLDDWGAWVQIIDEDDLAAELLAELADVVREDDITDVLRNANLAQNGGTLPETDRDNTFAGTQTVENPIVLSGESWNTPTLLNGWGNYGGGYAPARFRKLPSGIVIIQGLIQGGSTGSSFPSFVLPAGYRPNGRLIFRPRTNANSASDRLDVDSDGNVIMHTGGTSWFSINCEFYADQ